jgi:hypothetical protein
MVTSTDYTNDFTNILLTGYVSDSLRALCWQYYVLLIRNYLFEVDMPAI